MKKILFILILSFMLFSFESVRAQNFVSDEIKYFSNLTTENESCGLLGEVDDENSVAFYLQMALDVIKYTGVLLCVILTMVDFTKAVINQDKDAYKGLSVTAFKRFCYAIVLFFLPTIIMAVLKFTDIVGTCGIQ